jgi:hypothetical protein
MELDLLVDEIKLKKRELKAMTKRFEQLKQRNRVFTFNPHADSE